MVYMLTFKKNWWGGPPLVQSLDIVDNGPDKEWPKCFNAFMRVTRT